MAYSEHFGSRLSLADRQGDRRCALDAVGLALSQGRITWAQAVALRDDIRAGAGYYVLSHMNPLYEVLLSEAA